MNALKYSIVALLGVGFCASLAWRAVALRDLDERVFVLPSGFPGTEIVSNESSGTVAAVLFHGFQCNRVMMIELGRYLAHAGVHVFVLDFPGHGASRLGFVERTVAEQSAQAFRELVERYEISPAETAIIGHSFGNIALIKIAAVNPSVPSSVFIGPGYYGGASIETPRNVLVLTGEQDHTHIIAAASRLVAAATGGSEHGLGRLAGQPPFRRLWKSVPATGHLALLYNPVTFDETLSWIRQSQTGEADALTEGRSFVGVSAIPAIAGLLLFAAVFVWGTPHQTPPPSSTIHPAEMLLPFVTTPLAALWVSYLDPLAPQRILEGSAIVSTLFMSGLLAGAMVVMLGGRAATFRTPSRHIALAVGYFCLIYVIARLTISNDFYDLSLKLSGRRISAFVLFSLCSALFFLVMGGMLERLHRRLGRPPIRILVMALTLVCLSLLFPLCLNIIGTTLQRFFAPMVAVLLFLFGLQVMLLEGSRDSRGGAIFSGLVVGWVISVGFLSY